MVPGGALLICHLTYLALPGDVCSATEAPVLERNPAWSLAGETGLETFSLCLSQLLELLREEPPVRFRGCEVGGACESGLRGVSSSKAAQHRAAGCVHQVIAVKVGCDRVERSERSAGTCESLNAG